MITTDQRETASAVDSSKIATTRESIGTGDPQAMSIKVTMAAIRENSPKSTVERSNFIAWCEFVGAASLAFGSLVLLLAVVFNQIERDLAILTSAALLILNAIDKPTSRLTLTGTDPNNDSIFMGIDDDKTESRNQAGRAS